MRSLLCSVALCGVLAAGALAQETPKTKLNYAAMNKLGWKLSSQAYTFREMSLFETLDVLHSLGIRYVELFPGQRLSKEDTRSIDFNSPPEMITALQAKLKATNVTPVCYGVTGIPGDEAGARKLFDFAKKLGLINIVAEPGEDQFAMIDKLCQEYKINVAIHNHPEPSHYWNPDTVLKVTQGLSPRVGSCSDTGHWMRSGLVPLDCLKKLKGRIISLHFKDVVPEGNGYGDVPWGGGKCDAAGMLEELKRQGFKGVFSIEYERTSGQELIDNVAKCVQWFSDEATKLAKK